GRTAGKHVELRDRPRPDHVVCAFAASERRLSGRKPRYADHYLGTNRHVSHRCGVLKGASENPQPGSSSGRVRPQQRSPAGVSLALRSTKGSIGRKEDELTRPLAYLSSIPS